MDCGICEKHLTQEDGPHCPSCVRAMLYGVRLELARVLMEKEQMGAKIEAITKPQESNAPLDNELAILSAAWQNQWDAIDEEQAIEQDNELRRQLVISQKEVELKKARAQELRERLAEKKANVAAAKEALAKGQRKKYEELKAAYARGQTQHDSLHTKIVDAKAVLCREAASLLRLRHVKKKTKDGSIKDRYSIAGLPLPDLKDINSEPNPKFHWSWNCTKSLAPDMRCTELTAALDSVARLVTLCAYYLGVRLPAEITLPHRDYPLATVNTPTTSYSGQRVAFSATGSSLSAPSSPTASRMDLTSFPRPRPLFIGSFDHNEVVAQFMKKDPLTFSFFMEGVSLLAWDIAYLSRTQGFVQGTERWEDVCDVGRNLYQMILAPPQSAATFRTLTQRDLQIRQRRSQSTSASSASEKEMIVGRLGSGSHASAHTFLGSAAAAGDNPARNWRLNKYTMVVDPLKKHLVTEMNNAEWELLDEQEWDDGGEKMDEAVFIKTRAMDGKEYDDARSITTATKGADAGEEDVKGKGKSGWTKLKTRGP
jgi:hypothetical protein